MELDELDGFDGFVDVVPPVEEVDDALELDELLEDEEPPAGSELLHASSNDIPAPTNPRARPAVCMTR